MLFSLPRLESGMSSSSLGPRVLCALIYECLLKVFFMAQQNLFAASEIFLCTESRAARIIYNLCKSFSFSSESFLKLKLNFKLALEWHHSKSDPCSIRERRARKIVYHKFPHNYISNFTSGGEVGGGEAG